VEKLGDWSPEALLSRAAYAGIEALSLEALQTRAGDWLEPLLTGRRNLNVSQPEKIEAMLGLLSWDERQLLDQAAPRKFTSPAETTHTVDYAGDDAPSAEVRVQALFGLDMHPMIGRGEHARPLLLKLTSPAGRPIQSTRDLSGFWRGSWADVRKDMKGRYPKHRWPDEPWLEKPSLKTKNAFSKGER
jgi:ATP-dependent helicase HrpB